MKSALQVCFGLIFLFAFSCKKDTATQSSRSFYMGVTPWPADFNTEEVNNAYNFITNNCDIVSHHFDDGIPYQESFLNQPMPLALQQEVAFRRSKTLTGKKILLSISALNLTRRGKADYYKESSTDITDSIKGYWKQLSFNDPKMILAYVNYCSYLIEQLNPDFVNFGVESNVENWDNNQFVFYKDFLAGVYPLLKAKYPSIPFFLSFIVSENPNGFSMASQLMPYTDYIGLSAYPYTSVSSSANGNTDPNNFPADYFTRFIDMDKSKPFAFAETGYISENLVIPSFNLNKLGTPDWQQSYLEKICTLANDRKAKFIIWFCHKDYDAGTQTLKKLNLYQDLFGLWEDIGLIDEGGKERPAFESWRYWMSKVKAE